MASGIGESTSLPPESSSFSGNNNNNANDAGDFECNICFELAQDPIVTLCGHLFCWPCLYRWLHHHSHSHECPVCKALIQEEKLVPLYGRGKTQTDPRSKSYPGVDIPRRPSGQRPETAPPRPPPEANNFANYGFGLMGGFVPMATARIGNFTLSTAFGGLSLFPSLFNIQFHGFPDATVYGTTSGLPHGFHAFHGGHAHGFPQPMSRGQHADNVLKNLLLLIGVLVVLALLWW
ncbi:E3 ubiquitin-protein ligase RNF185 [Ricinus communis]|uniref:E3 ubiquitin-protein ligase RMA n=1 Tax=Ricinus communis TaxID=3988 RepID=B9T4V2_RICCO|nr:E3 ubiquitin-protein ligase RNF185 [Ricinus communis]XP_015583330.1 E3 ubiquitin-protein ligase RNF185 [Ricinus communis]EEF29103.1 rnf5, putative [Ricinus communis]|eukprot:XP_002533271.1 E3 ubiquitin-protein ligase RNF185 [Ricinus communis]